MIGYDVRNIIYIYIYNIRNNNKDKPALKISLFLRSTRNIDIKDRIVVFLKSGYK